MDEFNLLGINIHSQDKHFRNSGSVESILEGASPNLDSFKEVAEALKNFYTKEEVTELLAGGSEGSISLSDYMKISDADKKFQPKGDYVKQSELPNTSDFITMKDVEGKKYLTQEAVANFASKDDLFSKDYKDLKNIPTELPASDVYAWAKTVQKPSYTADEVGALPNTTVIPDAQVQSDWNAEEGMGVILNKPEVYTKEEVIDLYDVLAERIAALEASPSVPVQTSSKAYFAIVPGETTKEWKANLAQGLIFTELPEGGSEINSDSESGMIAVLYNKWIPRFDVFDEGAQSWQESETPLTSVFADGKMVNGEKYILWYNTGATVDENTRFKIILP